MQRQGDHTDVAMRNLELVRGVAALSMGRSRRGIRRIERALSGFDDDTSSPWMRSRARIAIARYLLNEAGDLTLSGDKRAARRLARRAELMGMAEQQIIAIARLGEPEYILDGMMLMGDAYLILYDDMNAAAPPTTLSEAEIEASTFAEKMHDNNANVGQVFNSWIRWMRRDGLPDVLSFWSDT